MKALIKLTVFVLLTGCTTIGISNPDAVKRQDFGREEVLRICVYKNDSVSDTQVSELIRGVRNELASFGVTVEVPWTKTWSRPAFTMQGIIKDVSAHPLDCPCDRLFFFLGRDYGDFLWGIVMPEVLGAVEETTLTKGYAVAEWGSLTQVLSLLSPQDIAIHESYHLLGCGHGLSAAPCYDRIAQIKRAARTNRETGQDFFPAMTLSGEILWTRSLVDQALGLDQKEVSCS